jgi:hypothetical protein
LVISVFANTLHQPLKKKQFLDARNFQTFASVFKWGIQRRRSVADRCLRQTSAVGGIPAQLASNDFWPAS